MYEELFETETEMESEDEFRRRGRFQPRSQAWRQPPPRAGFGRVRPFVYNLKRQPQPRPQILAAQRRVSQLLQRPLPYTGVPGPAFRWALRLLQSRYGLPVTGILDFGTQAILDGPSADPAYAAPAYAQQSPFVDSAPPEGNAWLPPDSLSGEPPPMASDGGEEDPGPPTEEEFHVIRGCHAVLRRGTPQKADKVADQAVSAKPGAALLPRGAGLYVIRQGATVLYVGKALAGIHSRFMDRFRIFREFNIKTSILKDFEIVPYAYLSNARTLRANCEIRRGDKGSSATTPLDSYGAVLAVLEQHFIQSLRPTQNANQENFGGNKISFSIIGRDNSDPPTYPKGLCLLPPCAIAARDR